MCRNQVGEMAKKGASESIQCNAPGATNAPGAFCFFGIHRDDATDATDATDAGVGLMRFSQSECMNGRSSEGA